jgi:hypothetical protein
VVEVLVGVLVSRQLGAIDVGTQDETLSIEVFLQAANNRFGIVAATVQEDVKPAKTGGMVESHPFGQPACAIPLDRAYA